MSTSSGVPRGRRRLERASGRGHATPNGTLDQVGVRPMDESLDSLEVGIQGSGVANRKGLKRPPLDAFNDSVQVGCRAIHECGSWEGGPPFAKRLKRIKTELSDCAQVSCSETSLQGNSEGAHVHIAKGSRRLASLQPVPLFDCDRVGSGLLSGDDSGRGQSSAVRRSERLERRRQLQLCNSPDCSCWGSLEVGNCKAPVPISGALNRTNSLWSEQFCSSAERSSWGSGNSFRERTPYGGLLKSPAKQRRVPTCHSPQCSSQENVEDSGRVAHVSMSGELKWLTRPWLQLRRCSQRFAGKQVGMGLGPGGCLVPVRRQSDWGMRQALPACDYVRVRSQNVAEEGDRKEGHVLGATKTERVEKASGPVFVSGSALSGGGSDEGTPSISRAGRLGRRHSVQLCKCVDGDGLKRLEGTIKKVIQHDPHRANVAGPCKPRVAPWRPSYGAAQHRNSNQTTKTSSPSTSIRSSPDPRACGSAFKSSSESSSLREKHDGAGEVDRRFLICSDFTRGMEDLPIPVVNTVDADLPPSITKDEVADEAARNGPKWVVFTDYEFTYAMDSRMARKIPLPRAAKVPHKYRYRPHEHVKELNHGRLPYVLGKDGVPTLTHPLSISIECGPWCQCPHGRFCPQAASQVGLRWRLQIFKTAHCGWGIRTLEPIRKGVYIATYHGTVMRVEDVGPELDDTYFFDICKRTDMADDNAPLSDDEETVDVRYLVDARGYGSCMRFVNHCCDPNLYVQPVLSDHVDRTMPKICLFTMKDVACGEELTCDYGPAYVKTNMGGQCNCGAAVHHNMESTASEASLSGSDCGSDSEDDEDGSFDLWMLCKGTGLKLQLVGAFSFKAHGCAQVVKLM
eukprot:evm.model.scf_824.3 EVM.evm.TU.scf_824.3   scf_824:51436-59843(+)